MESFRAKLRKLLADTVFLRVVLVLFSVPFFWFAGAGALEWGLIAPRNWYLSLLVFGLGAIGLALAYAGLFGRDALVKKIGSALDPGAGEWLGLLFAVVVLAFALPLTMAIRFFFPSKDNEGESL